MSIIRIISSFFRRRLVQPVLNLFKQGMTPAKLGATIAVGTMVGIIPFLGVTTVLATALAARFRLNIAATVLISYLVQPLQILCAIPFIKLGILVFGLDELKLTFGEMQALFQADWLMALNQLWKANLAGVTAWAILSFPVGWVFYLLLVPLLKTMLPAPVLASVQEPEVFAIQEKEAEIF